MTDIYEFVGECLLCGHLCDPNDAVYVDDELVCETCYHNTPDIEAAIQEILDEGA